MNNVNHINANLFNDLFEELMDAEENLIMEERDGTPEGVDEFGDIVDGLIEKVISLLGPAGTLNIIEGYRPILSLGDGTFMVDGNEIEVDDYMTAFEVKESAEIA